MSYVIGVDIGGTTIKAGLFSRNLELLKKTEIATESDKGQKKVVSNILDAISLVFDKKVVAIGVGSPGPLDAKKGIILNPVNLPLRNVSIKKIIEEKFRRKTILENDASSFALGHALKGQGKNKSVVLGITIGTGIGGGLVIDKHLYRGRGNALEIGHTTIKFDGNHSLAGNRGSIESYISSAAIKKGPGKNSSSFEIFKRAEKGSKEAKRIFNDMGFYLGIFVTNMLYTFDPDIIIIGGKRANAWHYFEKEMMKQVKIRYFGKPCPIVKSKIKGMGMVGAAALANKA